MKRECLCSDSDLMWLQHILMSNSLSCPCPSCDQPLLPSWKMCHNVFGSFLGRGSWGLMTRRDFFGVIVGGGGGVSGNGDIGAGPPRHARHSSSSAFYWHSKTD